MSQSLAQLWIHIIFSTKKRYPFLNDPNIRKRVHEYLKTTWHRLDCEAIIVGGAEDHVHLLVRLSKNITLSSLIEKIKKSSSKWIKTLETSDSILRKFYWQNGYGAFSVSRSNVEQVKHYIYRQIEHHRKYNFQEEFKKFLIQHGASYEEKYLWD